MASTSDKLRVLRATDRATRIWIMGRLCRGSLSVWSLSSHVGSECFVVDIRPGAESLETIVVRDCSLLLLKLVE
jgi:hypothetical protein